METPKKNVDLQRQGTIVVAAWVVTSVIGTIMLCLLIFLHERKYCFIRNANSRPSSQASLTVRKRFPEHDVEEGNITDMQAWNDLQIRAELARDGVKPSTADVVSASQPRSSSSQASRPCAMFVVGDPSPSNLPASETPER
ncbi:hypothetical protein F5Y15DRAFT_415147 [Xylariaceae sp. FL0016]|nr:hypothetical protein F5Y15DRAFT_415147 [Xylariaceae sp. FL0016]